MTAVAALLLAAACQSPGPATSSSAAAVTATAAPVDRAALDAALGQCTATTGYDPVAAQAPLAESLLGAGELEWRSCAYDALNTVVRPQLFQPHHKVVAAAKDAGLIIRPLPNGDVAGWLRPTR